MVVGSIIDPTTHLLYLHQDVALIAMPQSTLQQRAALVATLSVSIEQLTPIILMFGSDDHLDLNVHMKKLFAKNVTTQDIQDAVLCIHQGCTDARNKLLGERTKVVFVSVPGNLSWPEALQKVIATVALRYRSLETTQCGGVMPIDEFMRPHRIDYPRLLAELSKTLSSMPLLEPLELTIDDCTLRQHNAYMRSFQPWNEQQEPIEPLKVLLRKIELSMRITGDGSVSGRKASRNSGLASQTKTSARFFGNSRR